MAGSSSGKRPLSPHLTVYRPQVTSILSIFHRASGVAMAASMALIVIWLLSASMGPDEFAFVDGWLTSWIGALVMLGSAAAFFYHLCNGIRHMWWDIGWGFEMGQVTASGLLVLICTGGLTVVLAFVAM